MALRELLATFTVRVEGADQLIAVDSVLNRTAGSSKHLEETLSGTGAAFHETADGAKAATEGAEGAAKAAEGGARSWGNLAENVYYTTTVLVEAGKWLAGAILSIQNASLLVNGLGLALSSFLGLGVYKVTGAMWGWIEATAEEANEISRLAGVIGLTTTQTQEWAHMAQLAGATNEDLRASFKTLGTQMTNAADEASPAAKIFKELGISIRDDVTKEARPLNDVMLDATTAIASMSDRGKQLALTQTLLGEGAVKMLGSFRGTREEMVAQLRAAGDLAGVYDEEFLKASAGVTADLATMRSSFTVLRSVVVSAFIPSFRWAISIVTNITSRFRAFLKETGLIDRWVKGGVLWSFVRISSVLVGYWAWISRYLGWAVRFLTPLVRFIARFAAWALILDDIMTFLEGGNSLLGEWLDKLFGAGTANAILTTMWGLWDKVKVAIGLAVEVLGWLFDDLNRVDAEVAEGSAAWDSWGGGAVKAIKWVIEAVKDLVSWLDKVTGWTEHLDAIGQMIFEAEDAAANANAAQEADWRAKDAAKTVKSATSPRAPVQNVVNTTNDSSRVTVNLNGPATPETVRVATAEARSLKSNKGMQNAVIRGTP